MTIDKAIKILEDSYYKHTILLAGEEDVALNLGIEALKEVEHLRIWRNAKVVTLLLGETEE